MYYEVYIDAVFVTNLFMDYLLLRFVGKVFRCGASRKRSLLAAAMGALFSCLILFLPVDSVLPGMILHGACALGMTAVGCRLRKGGLLMKAMLTLYFAAFFCGGLWEVLAAGQRIRPQTFVLLAAATYLLLLACSYLFDSLRSRRRNIYPVTLSYLGKVQPLYGFYDSGNLLTDPVNGAPVSVVKPEILEAILSKELTDKLRYLKDNPGELENTETVGLHPRFLPYRTIGREDGLLLAVTLEKLCIRTPREEVQVERPVLAIAFDPSALGKEYEVLLNARLLQ